MLFVSKIRFMNIMLKGVKYKEAKQETPKYISFKIFYNRLLEGIKFKFLET